MSDALRLRGRALQLIATMLLCVSTAGAESSPKKIVLIGGPKSEGPARHDYPNGIRLLAALLESSPDVRQLGDAVVVHAHPDGWPADAAALEGAATLVWYFDGLDRHPLLDVARRARFEQLMKQGVGLVALHQSSTVPADDDTIELPRWLGGARYGLFDRTDEKVQLLTKAPAHTVSRGIATFAYFDEFYPTLRFTKERGGVAPVLVGRLHAQYRNGEPVIIGKPTVSTVAWAFERADGGRAFGYTGAHYLVALDEPAVRKLLLNAILWTAKVPVPEHGVRSLMPDGARRLAARSAARVEAAGRSTATQPIADSFRALAPVDIVVGSSSPDVTTFHADRERSGWYSRESILTPAAVAGPDFDLIWESPQLDAVDGTPARLYASPLYVDQVEISAGAFAGRRFAVVYAATSNGFVYAVNAFQSADVAPGAVLWRTQLGKPCRLEPVPLDGIATGILSTPVIDRPRKRLYVTSCEPEQRWQAHALDITSGKPIDSWPIRLDDKVLNTPGINRNAHGEPATLVRRFDYTVQRGALNLSPDGSLLYVTFGESPTGWIAAIDTAAAKVTSAFSTLPQPHRGGGGIWGAGGPAVDAQGHVYVATGTNYAPAIDQPHDWVQSVLKLVMTPTGFALAGTYTPFNYCTTAEMDIDLSSGGVSLLPDLDAGTTSTPHLLALGGKQGNVYLVDRARMPGRLDRRPPCSSDSSTDGSLLSADPQPQFGQRGPLNVFGPYTETDASMNMGRSRSVPAFFRDSAGSGYLFVTGTSRKPGSSASVPPSLARLAVVTQPGRAAYLRIDQLERMSALENPGSPVITSNSAKDAIVWVLDANAPRTASLAGSDAPRPVLYAFDALTLELLWKSRPGELHPSGKYNEPAFARGTVFVGTDRIQAFALRRPSLPRTASAPDGGAIYAQRCAICHDRPEGRIPPIQLLASRPERDLIEVLTTGAMRAQASGLSAAEIAAVARYVTQRKAEAR